MCSKELWAEHTRGSNGNGRELAVQAAGAGRHGGVRLSQQPPNLAGELGQSDSHLHMAQAHRHHALVATTTQTLQ